MRGRSRYAGDALRRTPMTDGTAHRCRRRARRGDDRAVRPRGAAGRAGGAHRPERLGQDDAPARAARGARARPGERALGRGAVPGVMTQERAAYTSTESLLAEFARATGESPVDARTLLAKFGRADHVARSCASLSPGERTRGAPGGGRQPAPARRADEPPRPRGRRAARAGARGVRRDARGRLARPALRRDGRSHARDRPVVRMPAVRVVRSGRRT